MPTTTATPTKAELDLLRVLWSHGASTVREIHEALSGRRSVTYTTTLKTLQVMMTKGLVTREARGIQHLYRAKHPEQQMQRRLVRDLLERAFDGSTARLVVQALASKRASKDELAEIKRLIDQYEQED